MTCMIVATFAFSVTNMTVCKTWRFLCIQFDAKEYYPQFSFSMLIKQKSMHMYTFYAPNLEL